MIDWNPFEPDEIPIEPQGARKWIERIFHGFMLATLFGIVFTLSGTFLLMRLSRLTYSVDGETSAAAIIIFGTGGTIGALLFARICFAKWGK